MDIKNNYSAILGRQSLSQSDGHIFFVLILDENTD